MLFIKGRMVFISIILKQPVKKKLKENISILKTICNSNNCFSILI